MKSITRKFLVREMPDISNVVRSHLIRFYLYRKGNVTIRIQSKDNQKFELERKSDKSNLVRESERTKLTREEFEALNRLCSEKVERDSYEIQQNPQILLRVYKGRFKGLVRAEVNFETEEQANDFTPYHWMGKEITNSSLAKEGTLLELSEKEFQRLLKAEK